MSEMLDRKLPRSVTWSYFLYSLGSNSVWMLNNYFLLFFYTDVIRIPAAAATVIMLIARVWDAINDPLMGIICDKTKSKEGKSRFWLKYICAPATIFIALSYFCPGWATPAKVIWVAIAYIMQDFVMTAAGIPLNTLRVSMTTNRGERLKLTQYIAFPGILTNLIIPAVTMPFVNSFGTENLVIGFFVLAAIIGVVYGLGTFLIYKSSKGLDPDTSGIAVAEEEKTAQPSALELIKGCLKNKYCLLVCGAYCTYLLLSGLMGSTLIYYFTYNVQNTALMGLYSTAMVPAGLVAVFVMRVLGKKLGNAKTGIVGCVICILFFIPRIITGDSNTVIFVISMAGIGLGSGLLSNMVQQCILDAATYGKLHTGMDNQGVIMAAFNFSQKLGQALSSVIASGLLAIFNYTAGETPSPTILKLFYAENIVIPMFIALGVIIFLVFINKMEKQLAKRLAEEAAKAE